MNIIKYPARSDWKSILSRPTLNTATLRDTVLQVLGAIREKGDKAVIEYEEKFDKVKLSSLEVTEEEFAEAELLTDSKLKEAIGNALENIRTFHASQKFEGKKSPQLPA